MRNHKKIMMNENPVSVIFSTSNESKMGKSCWIFTFSPAFFIFGKHGRFSLEIILCTKLAVDLGGLSALLHENINIQSTYFFVSKWDILTFYDYEVIIIFYDITRAQSFFFYFTLFVFRAKSKNSFFLSFANFKSENNLAVKALFLLIKLEFILLECLLSCERFLSCHKPFNPPFFLQEGKKRGKEKVCYTISTFSTWKEEGFQVGGTTIGARLAVQQKLYRVLQSLHTSYSLT